MSILTASSLHSPSTSIDSQADQTETSALGNGRNAEVSSPSTPSDPSASPATMEMTRSESNNHAVVCSYVCSCQCFKWWNPEFYGPGTETCQRSITMIVMSVMLMSIGALLTGLGYWNIIEGSPTLTGPMCLGLALLLFAVAGRYFYLAKHERDNITQTDGNNNEEEERSESSDSDSFRDVNEEDLPPSYSAAVMNRQLSENGPSTPPTPQEETEVLQNTDIENREVRVIFNLDEVEQEVSSTRSLSPELPNSIRQYNAECAIIGNSANSHRTDICDHVTDTGHVTSHMTNGDMASVEICNLQIFETIYDETNSLSMSDNGDFSTLPPSYTDVELSATLPADLTINQENMITYF